jgi:hypothetical protein
MPHLFIELYNYRQAWRDLQQEERERVRAGELEGLEGLKRAGLEVIGWGFNDAATDQRADYDFFCAYRAPSAEFVRQFESGIRQSGWHDLFEQVGVSSRKRIVRVIPHRDI